MTGPYREAHRADVLEAPTRRGIARLELAPDHTLLSIGNVVRVSVTSQWFTVTTGDLRLSPRSRSLRLDRSRLVVARSYPTGEVGLWHEPAPGALGRVLGLPPLKILDPASLDASRALDALGDRLEEAIAPHLGNARQAVEFGGGGHRVLLVVEDDRMIVYARPLWREWVRRLAEVRRDGTVLLPNGRRDRALTCTSRYAVLVRGDWISFESTSKDERADLWLPFLAPEDRRELTTLLGRMVDTGDAYGEPSLRSNVAW